MENEREQAVHFLEDNERECTALMEQVLKNTEQVFAVEYTENKSWCCFLYLKNIYTLLHYIPFAKNNFKNDFNFSENEINELTELFKNFLSEHPVSCVYGEYDGSVFVNSVLEKIGKKKIKDNEYILMENDFSDQIYKDEIEERKDVIARKCSIDDMKNLFELEKGYQIEEVQVIEHKENEKIVNFILNKALSSQNVFASFLKNSFEAVSKAATNGLGKNYFQIGGVYCKQDYRCRGITKFTMMHLLKFINASGKKADLFVKVKNESGRKLYESLKFTECGRYMISYFEK